LRGSGLDSQQYSEAPTVLLISLNELPAPPLPSFEDTSFDNDIFNFDIDYRHDWEDNLEDTNNVSFEICEDMLPPLYGPHIDDSSSYYSYTTIQIKNDSSVDSILYRLPLQSYEDISVKIVDPPPISSITR
jgi:hypothetical protein